MYDEIKAKLKSANLRFTIPRKTVFETLQHASKPLSISEIIKINNKIDKVSIYRTIDTLTKNGITTTVPHGWKLHYELAEPFKPHHHHLRCLKCNILTDINSHELEAQLAHIGEMHHFQITSHGIELSGICVDCQSL